MTTASTSTGYHDSPEALRAELRRSSSLYYHRADELNGDKPSLELASALMAGAYSYVLADVLQWVEQNVPEKAHGLHVAVDDMLMNGGSLYEGGYDRSDRLDGLSDEVRHP